MVGIMDIIENSPQYVAEMEVQGTAQAPEQEAQAEKGGSLSAVLDMERGDIEFWVNVGQLVLLVYIAYQLSQA